MYATCLLCRLYQSEMAWLVYVVQSRALGKRLLRPEAPGIDWDAIDERGEATKPEGVKDFLAACEPSDMDPPGAQVRLYCGRGCSTLLMPTLPALLTPVLLYSWPPRLPYSCPSLFCMATLPYSCPSLFTPPPLPGPLPCGLPLLGSPPLGPLPQGPPLLGSIAGTGASLAGLTNVAGATNKGLMICVGMAGLLGGVWRAPGLALSEFSTSPAELLHVHSVAGVVALLQPGGVAQAALKAAAEAQALRAISLELSVRHNQVCARP